MRIVLLDSVSESMSFNEWRHNERRRHYSSYNDYHKKKKRKRNSRSFSEETIRKKYVLESKYQPQFMNYQLIGDRISCMILNSEEEVYDIDTISFGNYIHSNWDSHDLLCKLESTEINHPIAKRIILSVGYNDVVKRNRTPVELIENIRDIINELRRKGCLDIILTNIPPCACIAPIADHWQNLQVVNDSIEVMYRTSGDVTICDIFKLFCEPNNIFKRDKYIVNGVVNYKIIKSLYNKYSHKNNLDLFTFSLHGRLELKEHLKEVVRYRFKQFTIFDDNENDIWSRNNNKAEHNKVENDKTDYDVIIIDDEKDNVKKESDCNSIIKIEDSESDTDNGSFADDATTKNQQPNLKSASTSMPSFIPIVTIDDTENVSEGQETSNTEDKSNVHAFGCKCKCCKTEDRKLILGFLTTISTVENKSRNSETSKD